MNPNDTNGVMAAPKPSGCAYPNCAGEKPEADADGCCKCPIGELGTPAALGPPVPRSYGVPPCPKGKGDCARVLPDKRCFACPAGVGGRDE